jgi:hypothetical protein
MKVTLSKNRFEVIVESLDPKEAEEVIRMFQDWILDKQLPSDEDYALGPCSK